jgi:hypothetical protein
MAFSWSYSKLKNFDTCPKRHYEVDVAKHFRDNTEQLDWGNRVHKSLADACKGKVALPEELKDYAKWVHAMRAAPGEMLVEQKYALTKDFQPCEWFGPRVWVRGVGDLVKINGTKALGVDWKTGNVLHDSPQLMILAQCIFAFHPEVETVETIFVWLKDDCLTRDTFHRATIANEWVGVLERVKQLEDAATTMNYPPKPGKLCRSYCPVLSCPYHGKGYAR